MVPALKLHRDNRREPSIDNRPKAYIARSLATLNSSQQEYDGVSVLGMKTFKISCVGDSHVSVAHLHGVPRIESQ